MRQGEPFDLHGLLMLLFIVAIVGLAIGIGALVGLIAG